MGDEHIDYNNANGNPKIADLLAAVQAARTDVMRNEERRALELKRLTEIKGMPLPEAVDALQKHFADQNKRVPKTG